MILHPFSRFILSLRPVVLMLLVLAFIGTSCVPQPLLREEQVDVPLWGRWEQRFEAEEKIAPETEVTVRLTTPSGAVHEQPAFWDGGRVWRVRFMPDEEGTWSYQVGAPAGVPGLSGRQGQFTVRKDEGSNNRFLRHGPVQVSRNGRYLVHSDGTPFFWLSDTAWNGALKSTEEGWESYLLDRKGKQFTGIQFVTTQWRAARANAEDEVAYTGYEDITINPDFFDRLDQRISTVNETGLLAVPVLLWALGEQKEVPGKLPEDQAVRLARYLVARYGAHHVVWFLAGDENYAGERGERWKRIGRAVFGEGEHAPVTLHPQGMQWHFDTFLEEDWLDLLIYQSGHGDSPETLEWIHSGPPSTEWKQEPARPVINSEPPYEDHIAYQSGEPHPAYNVRRAVYWSLLNAPTAGVSYGAHGIWSWETEPNEPLNHEGSGVAQPWFEAIDLPGGSDMEHVAELFTSVDWWTLRPDEEDLLVRQPGGDDPARYVAAARSEEGDLAVLYLPVGGSVTLNTDLLDAGLQAEWFNPRTGERQPAGEGEVQRTFSAPSSEDWVLYFYE